MKPFCRNIWAFAFAALFASAATAWDFLYVEKTIESTRIVEITPLDLSGQGMLQFEDECDVCPDSLSYNLETKLTTPFGENQDIYSLTQWQGHRAMVHYSTTNPVALRIVVYSATDVEENF